MARLNPKRRRELALHKAKIAEAKATDTVLTSREGHVRNSTKAHKLNEAVGVGDFLLERRIGRLSYDLSREVEGKRTGKGGMKIARKGSRKPFDRT